MAFETPVTEAELFVAYRTYVKPLYCNVQALTGKMPLEVLNEMNAALDHISRIYTDNSDPDEEHIRRAWAHFKRACLDIFKLQLVDVHKQYVTLGENRSALQLIDSGRFVKRMEESYQEIKELAAKARYEESTHGEVDPFGSWCSVYDKSCDFTKNIYNHADITWAVGQEGKIKDAEKAVILEKGYRRGGKFGLIKGLVIGTVTSILGTLILLWLDII